MLTSKGRRYNFRGSLALVSADNLASQAIGGYKALNSALRKCRHCMAVRLPCQPRYEFCLSHNKIVFSNRI